MAEVLRALGAEHAFVVHGADGLDELSATGPNKVSELRNNHIETYYLDPQDLGLPRGRLSDLAGGTAEENVIITKALLKGERGPKRDVVLLNAAGVLLVGSAAKDLSDGLKLAAESVDSGNALRKLEQLVEFSQSFN
jgi:anthranilate phosphoribosyltransferase